MPGTCLSVLGLLMVTAGLLTVLTTYGEDSDSVEESLLYVGPVFLAVGTSVLFGGCVLMAVTYVKHRRRQRKVWRPNAIDGSRRAEACQRPEERFVDGTQGDHPQPKRSWRGRTETYCLNTWPSSGQNHTEGDLGIVLGVRNTSAMQEQFTSNGFCSLNGRVPNTGLGDDRVSSWERY